MPGPRSSWLCLAIASTFTASIARGDHDLEPVRLVYRAPPSCPGVDDFMADVRRAVPRMRLARIDESARLFEIAIRDDGRRGRLTVEKGGAAGVRDAEGADCAEVARVLAFATALSVDPDAVPPEPDVERAPPDVPPRSPTRSSQVSAPPTPDRWGLGGLVLAESVSAPTATFGGGVFGDLGFHLGGLEPLLRLGFGYTASAPASADGAKVTFASALGMFEACPTVWGGARLSVRPCLRAEGGLRTAGARDIPGGHSVTRPWFALGAAAHFRLSLGGAFFADVGGGVLFPTVRDRVYLAPDTTVHDVPAIGGLGELGLGVEFRDQIRN